jgi:uncharacterized protein (TIGR04255 family)
MSVSPVGIASAHQHLRNAPIAEALVDIRASLADDFDAELLRDVRARLPGQFTDAEPMFEQHTSVRIADGELATDVTPRRLRGYLFRSSDARTIVQLRRDGFTLNRLRPYTSWGEIRPQALACWEVFQRVARPLAPSRIGLRYINQIDIALTGAELGDYLRLSPGVPDGGQRVLTEFFARVVLTDLQTGLSAAITQASQPASAHVGVVILDIDAYRAASGGVPHADVPQTLDALRTFKNDLFFQSVTPLTVEKYA